MLYCAVLCCIVLCCNMLYCIKQINQNLWKYFKQRKLVCPIICLRRIWEKIFRPQKTNFFPQKKKEKQKKFCKAIYSLSWHPVRNNNLTDTSRFYKDTFHIKPAMLGHDCWLIVFYKRVIRLSGFLFYYKWFEKYQRIIWRYPLKWWL